AFLRFLPDGKSLLAVCKDGITHVWDRQTGTLIRSFGVLRNLQMPERLQQTSSGTARVKPTFRMDVALSQDGRVLATTHSGSLVRLWDPATGKEQGRIQLSETSGSPTIALSADCKMLLSSDDGLQVFHFWDTAPGKEIRTVGEKEQGAEAVVLGQG